MKIVRPKHQMPEQEELAEQLRMTISASLNSPFISTLNMTVVFFARKALEQSATVVTCDCHLLLKEKGLITLSARAAKAAKFLGVSGASVIHVSQFV